MAVTASGIFGLSIEKYLTDTMGKSLESETDVLCALITDSATPDFNTHDFWNDLSANEATDSNANWTAGGETVTTTEITLSGGVLTYDAADVSVANTTISGAMAAVLNHATTNELIMLSDFVTAASTTNGTFTVQWSASGIFTIDYTP